MSLQAKLREDMKIAMKAKDKIRLSTIRLLLSALKNVEIEKKDVLSEKEELSILSTQAKRRRESIKAYEEGNRVDLAEKEKAELEILKDYLPQQLTKEEAITILQEVITSVGATSKKDFGKVMKEVMPKFKGRFPGKEVKGLVEEFLK